MTAACAASLAQCIEAAVQPDAAQLSLGGRHHLHPNAQCWLYLAVVLDLFARKVVVWAMAPDKQATLVCEALQLAIAQRQPAAGLIVHSDRGAQYASAAHHALLSKHGLVGSMSCKGNCWDNSVMKRFFLNLKMARACQRDYANHTEANNDIAVNIVSLGLLSGFHL